MTVRTPAHTPAPASAGQPARRRMHLAAHVPGAADLPGADEPGARADPRAGAPADFASYARLARTAERGLFDFLLLTEELRLREHGGNVHRADAAGRPEPVTALNALAAVTGRLGLAASVGTRFTEPYELARGFATLDHLSGGRAAWHVAHTADPLAGENFRGDGPPDPRPGPGGPVDRASVDRASVDRAAEFLATARELWDSWTPDGVSRPFAHRGRYFDIAGEFTVARSPQGHPVVIREVDTPQDREFAAAAADVVLTPHRTPAAGRALHADLKGRLAGYGRDHDDLKILSRATFVLGDTTAEARERAAAIRHLWVPPQTVIAALERIWGVDLSDHDPDGPLPVIDPLPGSAPVAGGARVPDPPAVAEEWRHLSRAKGLTSRQTVIEMAGRPSLVGTPESVAAGMEEFVRAGAADGFLLAPHPVPGGLDEFVDRVVPLLQERGAFRTEYAGPTLRSHLGLPDPVWKG